MTRPIPPSRPTTDLTRDRTSPTAANITGTRSLRYYRARHHRPHPRAHRRRAGIAAALAFAGSVAAANWLTSAYGLIPVGFGLTATAGTFAAGYTLLSRDQIHDIAGRRGVLACIAAGVALSAVLAGPRLALASATAFAVSELADLLVYQPLRRRGFIGAVLASNAVGAPLDTIVFLSLAGMPIWTALPGQLWVKAWATALPLAVVLATHALLRHRLRSNRR